MELELKYVSLKEIISYSKQKEITILDKVNKDELEEIGIISNKRLQLLFLCASEGNFAFIENSNGIYNKEGNCYYPRDVTTPKGTAEYNKLEKLIRKWGFSSFHYNR